MQLELTLSPHLQRFLAVALAAVPLVVIGATLASFVQTQVERHEQAALFTHRLARERAVVSQAADWQARLSQLRAAPEWQGLLVVRARTQDGVLGQLVRNSGGKVDQKSARRMETTSAVEIDEHVIFSATIEQLSEVLQSLRGLRPLFVVRSIAVESPIGASGPPEAGPNRLHIELTVAEFERPL